MSVIFYVNNTATLSYLQGPVGGAENQSNGSDYKVRPIIMRDEKSGKDEKISVNPDFKKVAAVAYVDKDKKREVGLLFMYAYLCFES